MSETERRWFLIGLVFAFVIIGELLIAFYFPMDPGAFMYLFLMLLAMLPSHAALAAFWASLGGKASPWRLTAAIIGLVLLMYAYTMNEKFTYSFGMWYFVPLVLLAIQSALLMASRFFGIELTNIASSEESDADPDRQWMQFSIGAVLSWTTATAIIMAALRYVPEYCRPPDWHAPPSIYAIIAAISAGSTLIALSSIWITLGSKRAAARFVLLGICAVTAVLVLYFAITQGGGGEQFGQIVVFFLAQTVWLTGPLWLIRLAGYRLIWRRRVQF